MKIEDASKDNLLRLMTAGTFSGESVVGDRVATKGFPTGLAAIASESFELLMNESLEGFALKMNRGQDILRSLPTEVRAFVEKQTVPAGTSAASSLGDGLVPPVQVQRKFVEVVKALAHDFDILRNLSPEQRTQVMPEEVVHRIDVLVQKIASAAKQQDSSLEESMTDEDTFVRLVLQTGPSGAVSEKLSTWVAKVPLTISSSDPAMIEAFRVLTPLLAEVDPAVRELALRTQRIEFVTVAAILQAVRTKSFEQLPLPIREALAKWLTQSPELPSQKSISVAETLSLPLATKLEIILKQVSVNPTLENDLLELLELSGPALQETADETGTQTMPARMLPPEVREMASRLDKPGLAVLWQDAKATDLQRWVSQKPVSLEATAQSLREMATLYEIPKEALSQARASSGAMSYAWQLVFYPAGPDKPYPALVQVFRDGGDDEAAGVKNREDIWIRVALKTENIGVVDLSFHLQGRQYLSVMTRFADADTAAAFRQWRGELMETLSATTFDLRTFQIYSRTPASEG